MSWLMVMVWAGLISLVLSDWTNQCSNCECKWMGGKKVANCSNAGLTNIPHNLHRDIQVLYLDNNTITSLGANVFENNLPNLQKIFIRGSGIQTIHQDAFRNLQILIEVDLSYNNLTKLDRKTFTDNPRLKIISLSHNPLQVLEDHQFPTLPHLKTIDLSFCQINKIKTSCFGNLGNSIETISLIGNKLNHLQEEVFISILNLKSLELHRNPWKCDCNLKSFREWVVEKGLYNYPTTCQEPERLAQKLWDTIPAKEFACKPEILVSQGRVYSQPGTNVTLGCFIKGNPMPEAKWVLRGRIVNNNTSPLGSNHQLYLIHELGGLERWFNLTVINLQEVDADDYTCVAVNAGGVSEQNVSLTFDQPVTLGDIQEPRESNNKATTTLLAIAGGCMLSIVSVSLVSYFCCRSRYNNNNSNNIKKDQGCGSVDEQRLIEPRGILKHRDYSQQNNKTTESIFQAGGSNHTIISQSTLTSEFDQFPDLLNINARSSNTNTKEDNRRSNGSIMQCTVRPDQVLDPNSLVNGGCPPCCTGVPTAAILPPPPSFLAPYAPVQTVPLGRNNQSLNFITLPRNQKKIARGGGAEKAKRIRGWGSA